MFLFIKANLNLGRKTFRKCYPRSNSRAHVSCWSAKMSKCRTVWSEHRHDTRLNCYHPLEYTSVPTIWTSNNLLNLLLCSGGWYHLFISVSQCWWNSTKGLMSPWLWLHKYSADINSSCGGTQRSYRTYLVGRNEGLWQVFQLTGESCFINYL